MKEIGSEFWYEEPRGCKSSVFDYLKIGSDQKLTASGRSALYDIIKDIAIKKPIVYMPDYCCQSMIQPFIDYGCTIKYYKVDLLKNELVINLNEKFDIFFAMNYFGYSSTNPDYYIDFFSKKEKIIIEDITHRLFSEKNYCEKSTYLFASLRKWLPLYSGGIAVKMSGKLREAERGNIDKKQIEKRKKAMLMKRAYINGDQIPKEKFLDLYKTSNEYFKDYKNKIIDNESLRILKSTDINSIIKPRRKNIKEIYNVFIANKHVTLLATSPKDTPIYVPLLFKDTNLRNDVRKIAIEESIYLPIHWPIESQPVSSQSKNELSLICDQRYSQNTINEYCQRLSRIIEEAKC